MHQQHADAVEAPAGGRKVKPLGSPLKGQAVFKDARGQGAARGPVERGAQPVDVIGEVTVWTGRNRSRPNKGFSRSLAGGLRPIVRSSA